MDIEKIKQTMLMANSIRQEVENECHKLFVVAEEFKNKLLDERKRLPYHINIIDELHINENGHSRILLQILQFQNDKGEHDFLESLVHYIKQRSRSSEFESIVIDKPHITQEKARIDLWVRGKNYAIIFENKVYNAADQEAQLSRYIDKTKECGYREDTIFVVYLSQSGNEPAVQSWGNYKEMFKQRYINLSFRHDILPWLKDYVLPNIRQKDFLLHSAILQYTDYLEGLFYLRTTEKQMNMNLDDFITTQLNLSGKSDLECINILREKINDFNEVKSKMQSLLEAHKQSIIEKWKEETKQRFSELIPNSAKYGYTDVTFHQFNGGKDVVVFIGFENNRLFCQVEFYPYDEKDTVENTSIMELSDILPDKNNRCIWKWVDNDFDAAYKLFVEVVKRGRQIFQNK